MRIARKAALTGFVMSAALATGISSASAATVTPSRNLGTTVSTAGAVTPMHYTDCGWTGCTVYFNKKETRKISWGAGTCMTVIPGTIAKGMCGSMVVAAGYAVANDECIGVKVGFGAGVWPERNHHCY